MQNRQLGDANQLIGRIGDLMVATKLTVDR
jgi:hypothetical protein